VSARLQAAEEAQAAVLLVGEAPDLEYVVGTHGDAVGLSLAARALNDGAPPTRRGAALLAGARRIAGSAPSLLGVA
jgi:hypothetical protein